LGTADWAIEAHGNTPSKVGTTTKNPPAMLRAPGRMRGKLPWAFGTLAFSGERLGARPGARCEYVTVKIWDRKLVSLMTNIKQS